MRILLLLLVIITAIYPFTARAEEDFIIIQDSGLVCRVTADSKRGTIGRIKNGRFSAIGKNQLKQKLKSFKAKFKTVQKKGKAADRKRFNALGSDKYFALENIYGRLYRSAVGYERIIKELSACQKGNASQIDNLEDELNPVTKAAWDPASKFQPASDKPGESASEAFAYDAVNYYLSEKRFHGVTTVVAIHRSVDTLGYAFTAADMIEVIHRILHEFIHIHNGFTVDRFVFKVRAAGDSESFSLCLGGASVSTRFLTQLSLGQAHEIFHSWNGGVYTGAGNGSSDLFQLRTLVTEGWTVYYTYLAHAKTIAPYAFESAMRYFYELYRQYKGTEYDLPYSQLAAKASEFGTNGSVFLDMMNARAVLIAYYLDTELKKYGHSLDSLMRLLYQHGLNGEEFSFSGIKEMLSSLTGASFDSFFRNYINEAGDFTALYGENASFKARNPQIRFSSLGDI